MRIAITASPKDDQKRLDKLGRVMATLVDAMPDNRIKVESDADNVILEIDARYDDFELVRKALDQHEL